MAFLSVVVAACVLALVRELALRGRGTLSPAINQAGQAGLVATILLAFMVAGWQGALAMAAVAFFFAPLLAGIALFPLMRAGSRVGLRDHLGAPAAWERQQKTAVPTLDELRSQWERSKREHAVIAARPAIAAVLTAHGASAKDIDRIEGDIIRLGLGNRTARKVVSDPKLLDEHFQLEAQGITGMGLARVYLERYGGA
ncbi:MAG: hypothetical protein HY332_25180 [Chloroflexi bacterium]|nr:hypothetical protein [Chloroflexota bacterium]